MAELKERLSRTRLVAILDACSRLRVGVVGDFTLDAYWFADMTRSQLSRETPLYPRPVVRESYSPGGAANVAWNLADLGLDCIYAFTALGVDWRADLFRKVLDQIGVSLEFSVFDQNWSTPLYGKVVLQNGSLEQEDPRLDFVNLDPLAFQARTELHAGIKRAIPNLDAVVVADYQAVGVLDNGSRDWLNQLALENPEVVWVADSRDQVGAFTNMVLKPNEIEAARLVYPDRPFDTLSEQELEQGGLSLQAKTAKPVYITQGGRGCLLFHQGEVARLSAVQVPPPLDPVGAGDTFVASLAACLAAGADPWEAGSVASLASAVTVRMLNITGTASPQAVLDQYDAL